MSGYVIYFLLVSTIAFSWCAPYIEHENELFYLGTHEHGKCGFDGHAHFAPNDDLLINHAATNTIQGILEEPVMSSSKNTPHEEKAEYSDEIIDFDNVSKER